MMEQVLPSQSSREPPQHGFSALGSFDIAPGPYALPLAPKVSDVTSYAANTYLS